MRLALTISAAMLLGLAACDREEPAEPAMQDATAAADAGTYASATAESAPISSGSNAAGAANASTTESLAAPPLDTPGPDPVGQADRDAAQAEAESTNLQPRTN